MTIVCHAPDCPHCRHADYPLKAIDETHQHVIYQCTTCLNIRTISKSHCGGTLGAGRRDDMPAQRWIGHGWREHE